jgi:hypothetical protein
MFVFRTGYRALKLLRRSLLWLAVLGLSCSLISMGGLIWVDNSWALIPDGDPATSFDRSIFDIMAGQADCSDLDPDGDGQIPLTGGKLVKGNGDQDDNREEYFIFMPLAVVSGRGGLWSVSANHHQNRQVPFVSPVSKAGTEPKLKPGPSGLTHCRITVAYKDFGHLKVMSAEGDNYDIFTSVFIHKEGHPCIMGGLSYWR